MAAISKAKVTESPSLFERWGAALLFPSKAFRWSERCQGAGQAPVDLVILWLLGVVAIQSDALLRGWFVASEGNFGASLTLWLHVLTKELSAPLLILFVMSLLLWLVSGQGRNLGKDFDLVCVAFVPVVVTHLALFLVVSLAGLEHAAWVSTTVSSIAYGWGLLWWTNALRVTRSRTR